MEHRQLAWFFAVWAKASVMMREANLEKIRRPMKWACSFEKHTIPSYPTVFMAGLSLSPAPGVDFACTAVRRCATQRCCIQFRDIQSSFLGGICNLLVLPSPVALRCVTGVKSYVWKNVCCVVQWTTGLTLQKWTATLILSSHMLTHTHTHTHTECAKAPAVCSVSHWLGPTTGPTEIEHLTIYPDLV